MTNVASRAVHPQIPTAVRNWKVTLGIVLMSQVFSAMGFSMIFPFLPLYIQSLDSSMGLSTEFLAGMVIASQGIYDDDCCLRYWGNCGGSLWTEKDGTTGNAWVDP